MNFKYKCLVQTAFSNVPKGELLNYFFQKYVTGSLRLNNDHFHRKINKAFNHYKNYKDFNKVEAETGRYYEFGAGWTLLIPLTMSHLGFEVYCVDIRRLVIPELINDSLNRFYLNKDEMPFTYKAHKPTKNGNILTILANEYKLHYIAPKDARQTGFEENSFDFISSANTLEHIPKNDILPILKECYRILNKGGVLSMNIDYQDHWSYSDKSISIYNFLKYSSSEWKKYSPSLQYQNRMRHSDYLGLIERTGFKVVKDAPRTTSEIDKKALRGLVVADEFKKYSFDDLSIKGSEIVLLKE